MVKLRACSRALAIVVGLELLACGGKFVQSTPDPEPAAPASLDHGTEVDAAPAVDSGLGRAQTYFNAELHPSLSPTCNAGAGCHGPGAGVRDYFGADKRAAYREFKINNFHVSDALFGKGPHSGPSLTAAQMEKLAVWQELERD